MKPRTIITREGSRVTATPWRESVDDIWKEYYQIKGRKPRTRKPCCERSHAQLSAK